METEHSTTKECTVKKNKPGIIYLSSVPYGMNISGIQDYFEKFGEISNIFFQQSGRENYVGGKAGAIKQFNKPLKHKKGLQKGKIRYTEGWIEFKRKSRAKYVADMLNNMMVGGKKNTSYYDCLWNIKYIGRGFKWAHLRQRIEHEKEIHRRKMKNETRKITEEADQYIKSDEIAERLERKGKLGELGAMGGDMAKIGVKQRLTEGQILQKQQEKKLKDKKFKEKLQKSKIRKQQKKSENKLQKSEQAKSLKIFTE